MRLTSSTLSFAFLALGVLGAALSPGCAATTDVALPMADGGILPWPSGPSAQSCECVGASAGSVVACGETFCLGTTEYVCSSDNHWELTGGRCDAGAREPDAGHRIERDGGVSDAGTPSMCTLEGTSPPTTVCQASTLACLQKASTQAQWDACFAADAPCGACLDDAYLHCLVGTPARPGRCAPEYGCASSCVRSLCPDQSPSCTEGARAGACSSQVSTFEACYDPSLRANQTCAQTAHAQCRPTATCGNAFVEPGEACDGNCPTLCQVGGPCDSWKLEGSAASCSARCVNTPVQNCSYCAKNQSPSTSTGSSVFTGSFFSEADVFQAGSCGMAGRDAVYAWRAPATAVYDFMMGSFGAFASFGERIERTSSSGTLSILSGIACTPSATPLFCSLTKSSARLSLMSGQEVLVIGSRLLDTDSSDGVYDLTAPYWISIQACVPACAGKTCGSDGCGGTCGRCASGLTCTGTGTCACVPQCSGKTCGPDGCGGTCGSCASTQSCSSGGVCVCQPSCVGKTCGSNGCGGTCGTCGTGTSCSFGTCVADPDSCDPVTNLGCAAPNQCVLLSSEQTRCALTGSGTQGSACSSTVTCAGGYSCFAGTCRKVCDLTSGRGCSTGWTCKGVTGWTQYGACGTP